MAVVDVEILMKFLASVFGLIFAAFANIGQTHFVFTCNAVSTITELEE